MTTTTSFATYASRFLSDSLATTSTPPSSQPLFYSTRDSYLPFASEDDILGASYEEEPRGGGSQQHAGGGARRLSFGDASEEGEGDNEREGGNNNTPGQSLLLGRAGGVVPAFMSRLVGNAGVGRGWRAHDTTVLEPAYSDNEESYSDDEDEEEEEPPGAFLSTPQHHHHTGGGGRMGPSDEPLLGGGRTLSLASSIAATNGGGGGGGVQQKGYQDSGWIVVYGCALLVVLGLAVREALFSKAVTPTPTPSLPTSPFSTIPLILTLSLISLLAGLTSSTYILTIRHGFRRLIHLALLGGPLLGIACGVIAFGTSFTSENLGSELRWLAVGSWVMAGCAGRLAMRKRKQVERAVAIGELATQTLLSHPPLLLLCLLLSALSTLLALPFVLLLLNLLFDTSLSTSTSKFFGGWTTLLTLILYFWSLAILRGIQHVVVGAVVGSYYFDREEPDYPGAVEVTKAAFHRATHQSLGTIIFASAVTTLFTLFLRLLTFLQTRLRSKTLHPLLQPTTYLLPILGMLAGAVTAFNGYALCYAGMIGTGYRQSGKEVVQILRANRTSRLADSLLVRFVLITTSLVWSLLAGLGSFLLASSARSFDDPRMAPIAVLCFVVPMTTLKLCQDVLGDAVDALFICMNLDLQRGTNHSDKVTEAFGVKDQESFV